jgi:DNA processing protein
VPKARQGELFTPAPLPVAPLDEPERLACLRLIRSANVGPVTFRELINHYGGAAAALDALPELQRRGGLRAPRICPRPRAEAELAAARKAGAEPVFTIEPGYPRALAAVDAPPPMLYVKGRRELLSAPTLAIVGSREASAAGTKLTRLFAAELGRAGLTIVSGLARGIDACAHDASLGTGTAGVLAGGIDVVYPPEHAILQTRMGEEGCLVAEMPPGFVARGVDFPRRNRIIAGVSLGVLVIEAARRSGTLLTAKFANEMGRDVFAVPGHPLDPRAEGTNSLLKSGAILVTEPGDIVTFLQPIASSGARDFREAAPPPEQQPTPVPRRPPPSLAEGARARILTALGPHPVDMDEVARSTGLDAREVRIAIMELDLAGRIERQGGNLVSLKMLGTSTD